QVIAAADGTLSHNLFGMKAKSPQEPSVAITSQEFEHGRWLAREDHFRQYADWQNSVEDYLRTISESPRYQQAMNVAADPAAYAQALQDAGYATDPQYASKLQAVVASVQQTISRLGL
ncbi:MAG: glucosaminidase domain-containing protein, partial [Pseudomonadota bacterium]